MKLNDPISFISDRATQHSSRKPENTPPNGEPRMDDATCDKCGPAVRAYVYVQIGEHELSYCGSCATRYWTRLNQVGHVVDMRHLIPT